MPQLHFECRDFTIKQYYVDNEHIAFFSQTGSTYQIFQLLIKIKNFVTEIDYKIKFNY